MGHFSVAESEETVGIHDVIGVGFGPANIALAVAVKEEAPQLNCLFLEARPEVEWQPGMLMAGADIQNHPVRDLATLRNPRSRYTFINFLHEHGRLLAYLNLPVHFPLRRDYAQYVRWVAEECAAMAAYESEVVGVGVATAPCPHYVVKTANGGSYRGRVLVVGTGRTPYVPDVFAQLQGSRVFHSNDYRWRLEQRLENGPLASVAIVGASQGAAEIALDLHSRLRDCEITTVTRGFGYRLKDTSPFSEEAFLPEFTDYYFNASDRGKNDLDAQLRPTNYSSVDRDVIETLYVRRYEDELDGRRRLHMRRNSEILAAGLSTDGVSIDLQERYTGERSTLEAQLVVLATGFKDLGASERGETHPPLLSDLAPRLAVEASGTVRVARDYSLSAAEPDAPLPPLFLNGLCESTHGLGDAGSFSLLSLRAGTLLSGIRDRLRTSAAQ